MELDLKIRALRDRKHELREAMQALVLQLTLVEQDLAALEMERIEPALNKLIAEKRREIAEKTLIK